MDRDMQNRRGKTPSRLWEVEATNPLWLQLRPRQVISLSAPTEASACVAERPTTIPLSWPCDNINLAEKGALP